MGKALDERTVLAFIDEFTKQAGFLDRAGGYIGTKAGRMVSSLGENARELGWRLRHPVLGTKKGIMTMSPVGQQQLALGKAPEGTRIGVKDLERVQELKKVVESGKSPHLHPNYVTPEGTGWARRTAENLSRKGWTGQGGVTKYLPFGEKGMLAAGTAAFAPLSYQAFKEGRPAEEAGANLGFLLPLGLTTGTGALGFAGSMAGSIYAGRLGRALDLRRQARKLQDTFSQPPQL